MEEGISHRTNSIPPKAASPEKPAPRPLSSTTTTTVHVTALDAIVNVNALFTVATFIGLSLTPPAPDPSSRTSAGCHLVAADVRRLHVYEIVSFSFFLFSSLVAQGLKLTINLLNSKVLDVASEAEINGKVLRFGMLGSAVGSVMGCLFLMLSMIRVIELKLGILSCGGDAVWAATTLILLVSSALLVYMSTAIYAILQF